MPGQTIEDIVRAEAVFIEKVIALQPEADGKPCVIGNCQAGWALMMLAATRPELFGPIIIPGSPIMRWCTLSSRINLGNLGYALTARNFNPVIAMAADTVIACVDTSSRSVSLRPTTS